MHRTLEAKSNGRDTDLAQRSFRGFVAAILGLVGLSLAMVLPTDHAMAATYTAAANGCGNQSNSGATSPQLAAVSQLDCTASWFYGNASAISSEFGLGVSADGVSSCCGSASLFEALAQIGTQFIISGPTATVETSLNLYFEAGFPSGVVPGYSKREARIDLIMSQATFGTVGIYFGLYRDVADSGGRAFTYGGDLSQIPGVVIPGGEALDGTSVTPTFVVPVGVPVDITLALRGSVENVGNASGGMYALDTLYFPLSGPVFNLPDGYTATIFGLNVENNRVVRDDVGTAPEPSTLALLGLGAVGLFVARRRRKRAA